MQVFGGGAGCGGLRGMLLGFAEFGDGIGKCLAQAAIRRLQQLTAPLNEGLKGLYPRTQVISSDIESTWSCRRPR